jgi:acyl carrier protein
VVKATPSHLKLLQEEVNVGNNLKRFIVGGEIFEHTLATDIHRLFSGKVELHNEYGPTEATVGCMIHKYDHKQNNREMVPIGKPIDNVKIYLLDRDMMPVPLNAAGEIYIGGDALAPGYLNQVELTAERFDRDLWDYLDDHDKKEYKSYRYHRSYIYKTGDLARRLPGGNIEFLGRGDDQVKIRGYRIEIKEIENRLLEHHRVKEAVVLLKKSSSGAPAPGNEDDVYLCGYWVPVREGDSIDPMEIKEYLSGRLPDYMIPSLFVQLEQIPLSPNGKVDRKALPEPGKTVVDDNYTAPINQVERKLVKIWSEILGINKDTIGTRADFFQVGGHSLRATVMVSRIHKELHVKIPLAEVFKTSTIQGLAQYIANLEKDIYQDIKPVEKKEYYLQSSAQKRLFFLDHFEDIGTSYNMPYILKIRGKMVREHYEETFNALIRRHEALRTSFQLADGQPVQRIHDRVDFEIENYDIKRGRVEVNAGGEEEKPVTGEHSVKRVIDDFIRLFDLSKAPLLRAGLMRMSPGEYLLMFDMHHIIGDGTSTIILIEDFTRLFMGKELSALKIQYKDFSIWQNNLFATGGIKKQEDYWLNLYPDIGSIPVLNLPGDNPGGKVFSFEGAAHHFKIKAEHVSACKELASEMGATLYMNLLAMFNVLLHKYSGQEDIIVGTGIAGRPHADLEKIIGMFVNTLAIRNYPRGEITYREFLKQVKENCIQAFENQDMQFEELVSRISSDRASTKNPLFSVELNVQNFERPAPRSQETGETNDSPVTDYDFQRTTSKFDLILFATEVGDEVDCILEYSTALFKASTVEKMAQRYIDILEQVMENSTVKIKDIDILPELAEAPPVELQTEFQL